MQKLANGRSTLPCKALFSCIFEKAASQIIINLPFALRVTKLIIPKEKELAIFAFDRILGVWRTLFKNLERINGLHSY